MDLRLAAKTAGSGYDADEIPVEDLVKKLALRKNEETRPFVIWFYRPDEVETNDKLEANIFQNETIGLAFKRFHAYRVNVDTIGRDEIRKKYDRTPSFRFFNPAGKQVGKMEGRRVTSLSAFTRIVEKNWSATYSISLKAYVKDMCRILDRLDKVGALKKSIEADRARLAKKPNPRKQRKVEKDEERVQKEEAKIAEDEKKVVAKVKLKPEFAAKKTDDETAKSK